MEKIEIEDAKKIMLEMLVAFDKVCLDNNLRYILDCGTLLGAIRHKGFIPWDDDIDVSMPREDYNKLIDLFNNNDDLFGKDIKLSNYDNKYTTLKPYVNLVNIKTISASGVRRKKYWYPLWIDVFPVDYFFNNDDLIKKYRKITKLRKNALSPLMNYAKVDKFKTIKENLKSILKNTYHFIRNISIDSKFLIALRYKKITQIATETKNDGKVVMFFGTYIKNSVGNISYYNDYNLAEFEKHFFRVPKDYDNKLKTMYGDYMKLPPENERIPHFNDVFYI